ncbi:MULTISPECIES: nuclear transport factor 2 family protein [unclassified Ensifer]|uniref:nuclear transport factor 2 family protein n=1 Tax=unclassified Ensifer TaxID=2633371 RepID=UPI00070B1593|nr:MULTISPECIES: nuclear transport factor 2 family protein [unclassified Ensifer]KQW58982.1 hypothetical protein ASD02_08485 [Ensifer sp. Root1252]KRC67818.1 hypothetical protein ASE32_11945 [Ensifer sp. Root231]KRC98894.1 hypothetical protein ASE47_07135 [Ensifer sp. Root258]
MPDRTALEQTVHSLYAARDANDLEAMLACLHPTFSFRIVGSGRLGAMTQKVSNPEAVRSAFRGLVDAWDLSQMKTVQLDVDGNTVYAHRVGPIRFVPSDTWFDTEILDRLSFSDDRMADLTEFVDTLLVAETVGLVAMPAIAVDYSSSTRDSISL